MLRLRVPRFHQSAMRKIVVLAAALTIVTDSRGDEIDDYVNSQMAANQIPGVALRIVSHGSEKKRASYGFANLELNAPVTDETVFEIGSLTKQFTAACILMLQQDGKLSIDDKISRHLPGAPPAWSNITVRHLLTHTSGIANYTGHEGFELSRHLTQAQFIKAIAALPADFAPGEKFKYCNSGYNLLGFIIENVSGTNYWSFLAQRIFAPLGITTATNRDPTIVVRNRADGYIRKNKSLRNRDSDLTDVFSAGSIMARIGDLVKWNASLETEKLLKRASKTQMWTAASLNDGSPTPYGFGWRIGVVGGHKNIGHSGSTSGFSASLQRFPDDELTVILLCNSDEPNIATIMAKKIAAMSLPQKSSRP
jgi:CubicO group peptidase (beta-lactamase class C family)